MIPALGRYFTRDDVGRRARVVVLGHGLWRRRFGGDPSVVGTTIRAERRTAYRSSGSRRPSTRMTPPRRSCGRRSFSRHGSAPHGTHMFTVVAKLKPGVTREAAQADMARVTRGIAQREPKNMEGRSVNVGAVRRRAARRFRPNSVRAHRVGAARAADRLRERVEPAAGARTRDGARWRSAPHRRRPVAHHPAAADGEPRARCRRRRGWCGARLPLVPLFSRFGPARSRPDARLEPPVLVLRSRCHGADRADLRSRPGVSRRPRRTCWATSRGGTEPMRNRRDRLRARSWSPKSRSRSC